MVFRRARPLASILALAVLASGGIASADLGDLGGTQPGALANGGFFVDADTCKNCHGGGYMGDTTYLPHDTWAGTMMGNAARDPVFYAALSIANQDSAVLGGYCLRCHSPIGFVRGHTTPNDGSALDLIDQQGVGCDTCHRMTQSAAPDDPYLLGDAQIVYSDITGKHGKYTDAISPAHETVPDNGVLEPRFCGQCHQVTNPEKHLLDATGADTGLEFPFETTFEEWGSSAYAVPAGPDAAGCTDCHMVKKVGDWPLVKGVDPKLRKDPRAHTFVGGNHWGIRAVMEANPERATKYAIAFDNALKSTLENLATAVKVTVTDPPASLEPGATFDLTVKVENLAGHKFPTGYVDARQAWIAVTFLDCNQKEQTVLGAYDVATGKIQDTPPTHVYRAVHGSWNGSAGVAEQHLALQEMHLSDTRIPPKGFTASIATQPSTEIDYSDGAGGLKSFDEVKLTLTAPTDVVGAQTLSARVIFQSMRREYAEFLKDANTTDAKGTELYAIYQKTDEGPPLVIASADSTVAFAGECIPIGTGGAGGAGGGAGTAGAGAGGAPTGPAGSGGAAPQSSDEDDQNGCGCRTGAGTPLDARFLGALAAVALAALRRPRRT